MWDLVPDASGRAVESVGPNRWAHCTVESLARCRSTAAPEDVGECDYCGAGNGRFDAWATFQGKAPFDAAQVCVQVGQRGEGSDQAQLRRILATLRVVGPTGVPAPRLPGWSDTGVREPMSSQAAPAFARAEAFLPGVSWRTWDAVEGDFTYEGKPDVR